jgi:hypothetical protein
MTEDMIERIVESRTDAIDRRYMARSITEAEYRAELAALDKWAEWESRFAREG